MSENKQIKRFAIWSTVAAVSLLLLGLVGGQALSGVKAEVQRHKGQAEAGRDPSEVGKLRGDLYPASQSLPTKVQEPWGSLLWLANAKIGNAQGLTLGHVVIRAGQRNPRHSHPNCEEVLVLLRGRLKKYVGEKTYLMGPGDTIHIPAGTPHYAINIGDDNAEMIVVYDSANRQFKLEPQAGR